MPERDIYIAIGSNIEPARHIPAAVAELARFYAPLARSPAYRSRALGFDGPDFVNCVVRGRSNASAATVVARLKELERAHGRREDDAIGSRALDLDLILYGTEVIAGPTLTVPRPDILEYAFVLRPLAELAPHLAHPQTGRDFAWHWRHFVGAGLPLAPESLD
ncbi:MAG TPA: 2-amino-4-hydroxy-6-hydroxymethyldihydropteridine diphosphokinase [Gammaproteobacteria bacterium]|nr:2-amino-4-hydroxy-6-hydroxymethyldihydropteridine diphosphokinase [Gammaproteobacteria bacterium]